MTAAASTAEFRAVRYRSDDMLQWATECFCVLGLSGKDAGTLAESLLFAELRGVASHGLSRIPVYASRIRCGGINPQPQLGEQRCGAVCVIDADFGPGAPVALHAANVAADMAAVSGISLVAVRNLGHVGALGFYATRLADRGLVAIVTGNADPIMVPPGGGAAVLGSNPIAIASPCAPGRQTPLLDMATTAAAHGKIVMAAARGHAIPPGWAVDASGQETTDPTQALAGALLPAAGPKGFGLAFMIDVLSAGLAGGRIGREITPLYSDLHSPQGVCLLIIAIDPEHCAGREAVHSAAERATMAVKASRDGASGTPMIPGEPERILQEEAESIVSLPASIVEELSTVARAVGAELPLPIVAEPAQ